jgi:hypothetical protein
MALRRFLVVVLLPLWLVAGVTNGRAETPPDAVPAYRVAASDDDILVLEVLVDRHHASSGILAYRVGGEHFLPLGQLADVLELAIRVDVPSRRASGWIIAEERTFELDLESQRVLFDDHHEGLPDKSVYVGFDDIYVRSDLLSRWLPVDFELLLTQMRIRVHPREELPLTARLRRDQERARLSSRNTYESRFPERRAEYRPIAWPFVDLVLRSSRTQHTQVQEVTATGRGDLLNANASGFFRSRQGTFEETTGWLHFERTDRDRGLLGPLGATRVRVGDLFTRTVPFVSTGRRGRGVQVTNRDLERRSFDVTDVEGAANPGWDAELYVNGRLHTFQTVDESGRYRFVDVPIHRGTNYLRVMTYGPQGQEREDVHYVTVGANTRQRGELDYEVFAAQNELSILGTNLWNREGPTEGDWTHHLGLGYGLTDALAAEVSFDRIPGDDRTSDLLAVGLENSIGRMLWRLDWYDDLQSGHAARLGMNSSFLGQNVFSAFTAFDRFDTEAAQSSERDRWRARFRLNGGTGFRHRLPLGYSLELEHRSIDGPGINESTEVEMRGSTQFRGLQFVHELRLKRNAFANRNTATTATGSQILAGFLGRTRFHGSLNYTSSGDSRLQAIGLDAQRFVDNDLNFRFGVRRFMVGTRKTRFDTRLNWRQTNVVCGLEFRYDTAGNYEWGVSLTTSLSHRPGSREWEVRGRRVTNNGAALARTFVDVDGDGRFGPADEPMEGVTFRRNQRWRDRATDQNGRAWLTGLRPDRPVDIEVDLSSVFDPFLVPKHKGLSAVVHRGGVAEIEFPFHYVGDVEGIVYRDLLRNRPMPNVGLELVDPDGERIATTVTEFDGYYVFQKVPPGAYKIRVVASTLPFGDFVIPPAEPIVVPTNGAYVEGPEFVLVREGERLDIEFAEDGTVEELDADGLLGADASDRVLESLRRLLSRSGDRPSLDQLLSDPQLTDSERRTLQILHDLFVGSDDRYWLAR